MTTPDHQTPSMPPLPAISPHDHPESQVMVWSALEIEWIQRYAQAVADERVRAEAPDARRYRAFFDAGLPITYLGVDYRTKEELDAAIDASLAELKGTT